jgi:hypothetical protein
MGRAYPVGTRADHVRARRVRRRHWHPARGRLITVVDQRGTPEPAQVELMRYLAKAVWYPTTLLPRQGVRWDLIDEATARASLTFSP